MGYVTAKGLLGNAQKTKVEEVNFLADSGAFYVTIPPSLAERLDIKPIVDTELMLADKRKAKASLSLAYLKLLDREGIFPVAIMEVVEPLLGVTALEGLGVKIDPSTGRLEYSRPYGVALI